MRDIGEPEVGKVTSRRKQTRQSRKGDARQFEVLQMWGRLLHPRAYRAVARVGVRSEHNLRDGFGFGSSVDDLQHFLFGYVG